MKTAEEINVNNDGGNVSIYHLISQYTFIVMHVVAQLVEALTTSRKATVSAPGGVIGILH
jgi:hypothetical protein